MDLLFQFYIDVDIDIQYYSDIKAKSYPYISINQKTSSLIQKDRASISQTNSYYLM